MTRERHTRRYLGWFLVILLGLLWLGTDLEDITDDLLLQLWIGLAAGLATGMLLFLAIELLSFRQEVGTLRRLGEAVGAALSFAIVWVLRGWAVYQVKWAIRGGHTWLLIVDVSIPLLLLFAVFILRRRFNAFMSDNSRTKNPPSHHT